MLQLTVQTAYLLRLFDLGGISIYLSRSVTKCNLCPSTTNRRSSLVWGTYLLYHGERATTFSLEKRRTLPSSSSISPWRTKNSKYSTPRKMKQKKKTQARFENNKTERLFVFQIIIIIRHRIVWASLWKSWWYFLQFKFTSFWQKNKQKTKSNFSTPAAYPARACTPSA